MVVTLNGSCAGRPVLRTHHSVQLGFQSGNFSARQEDERRRNDVHSWRLRYVVAVEDATNREENASHSLRVETADYRGCDLEQGLKGPEQSQWRAYPPEMLRESEQPTTDPEACPPIIVRL